MKFELTELFNVNPPLTDVRDPRTLQQRETQLIELGQLLERAENMNRDVLAKSEVQLPHLRLHQSTPVPGDNVEPLLNKNVDSDPFADPLTSDPLRSMPVHPDRDESMLQVQIMSGTAVFLLSHCHPYEIFMLEFKFRTRRPIG